MLNGNLYYMPRVFPITLWGKVDQSNYVKVAARIEQYDLIIIIDEHTVLTKNGVLSVGYVTTRDFKKLS